MFDLMAATERQYPHPMPGEGIAASVADIAADIQRLVQLEIELARVEIQELVRRNAIAAGMLLAAAFSALFFLYTLVALIVLVVLWLTVYSALGYTALAFAIMLVFWGAVAAILGLVGRSRLKFAPPETSIQSIRDDVEWLKTQIRPAPR